MVLSGPIADGVVRTDRTITLAEGTDGCSLEVGVVDYTVENENAIRSRIDTGIPILRQPFNTETEAARFLEEQVRNSINHGFILERDEPQTTS